MKKSEDVQNPARPWYPGPWEVIPNDSVIRVRSQVDRSGYSGLYICHIERCLPEYHYNAALIAVSPEMYDALDRSTELLRDALKFINPSSGHGRCIQEQIEVNEEILKKARGENE